MTLVYCASRNKAGIFSWPRVLIQGYDSYVYDYPYQSIYHEMVNSTKPAFLLHILIEVPASLNFFFNPSATLSTPQPHAHAVIRQYAVLLMVTNILALIFCLRPPDLLSCRVAGALSLYHVGPLVRAVIRQSRGEQVRGGSRLGGPMVHAIVHFVCFWGLAIEFAACR